MVSHLIRHQTKTPKLTSPKGSRIRSLRLLPRAQRLTPLQVLVLALNTFALTMVITQTILFFSLPLNTSLTACRAAIYVCLPFYILAKVCMQLFLVERLHIIRWQHKRRCDDWIWVVSIAVIALGFGAIAVVALMYPIAKLATSHGGRCHIGLPYKVTIPLLTYDILINFALTGIFITLLYPLLKLRKNTTAALGAASRYPSIATPDTHREPLVRRNLRSLSSHCSSTASTTPSVSASHTPDTDSAPLAVELLPLYRQHQHHHNNNNSTQQISPPHVVPRPTAGENRDHRLRSLVVRTLAGTIVVLLPTIVNLTILYYLRGEEQGWMCYLLCMSDGEFGLHAFSRKSLACGGAERCGLLTVCCVFV